MERTLHISLITASVAVLVLVALSSGTEGDGQLAGLWEARKNFGPEIRGPLTIEKTKTGWAVEVSGSRLKAKVLGDRISFDVPGGKGRFTGTIRPTDERPRGHWIQPPPIQIGLSVASPVHFVRVGPSKWRGDVKPRESEYTFYLPITKTVDGELRTFLRNPDRNLGVFLNMKRIEQDGKRLRFIGSVFGQRDERVLAGGVYDPNLDQITVSLPSNRGGTYHFVRVDQKSDFYARSETPAAYRYVSPPPGNDGWDTGTLEEVGISLEPIKRMIEKEIDPPARSVHALYVHGFLIARHGKLVMEEYFHGFDREEPHDTRSASKSLTSFLLGAAIEAGELEDASTPVYGAFLGNEELARLDPRKRRLTLEHLLTMSSGFHCDDRDSAAPGNEETMQEQQDERDWYRYTLRVPMIAEPGETHVYCSANPNLAGGVLSAAVGKPLVDLFATLVADPLEIQRYYLVLQPTGEPYMGGGIHWLPRDFMKLGQVILNGGTWKGKRIISERWAKESVSPLHDLRGRKYGFLWWIIDYPYQDRTVKAFYAGGNGGQVVAGIPELDLVVAFYAGNYSDRVLFRIQEELIPEFILPALERD